MEEPGLALYEFSRRGRLEEVREELSKGESPNTYFSYDGTTPLLAAARGGHHEVVQALLEGRANIEVRTDDGSDALLHAASGGNAKVLSVLLGAKANIETKNEDEVTPLLLASHYGHDEAVKVLLESRADPNYIAPGWGSALDSAQGPCIALLEGLGVKRAPQEAAIAKAGEHFSYGCLDSPEAEAALQQYSTKTPEVQVSPSSSPSGLTSAMSRLQHLAGTVLGSCCGGLTTPGSSSTGRATPDATARFLQRKKLGLPPKTLGKSGLQVAPVGFGCHRIEDSGEHRLALAAAISCGMNLIDVAPNYTDGGAEVAVGKVLQELFSSKSVSRSELVVCTKVGNIVGSALKQPSLQTMPCVAKVRADVWHCIEPAWIEEELTRSLSRMGLDCIDVLLLHCPEFATKAPGVDMDEVYNRIQKAFLHLETEVQKGRVARYGISAAFYPLRASDPEHLILDRIISQLPKGHHFQVIQFPLNFAEVQPIWVSHTERDAHGVALNRERGLEASSLLDFARENGIATLTNRPLDGIHMEMGGILRFTSDVPMNSEMQGEDVDALEQKLTTISNGGLGDINDPVAQDLASKTIKCLASLDKVDCVLAGMRQVQYVANLVHLLQSTPPLSNEAASSAVRSMNNTISMWFCTATHEADHGTAKTWRLPERNSVAGG